MTDDLEQRLADVEARLVDAEATLRRIGESDYRGNESPERAEARRYLERHLL